MVRFVAAIAITRKWDENGMKMEQWDVGAWGHGGTGERRLRWD